MQTIGLFGGTFNPIHFGHLRMAQELAESLNLSEVRFIPSANPPHKSTPLVCAEDRAAMVKLAIANNPLFTLDDRELRRTATDKMPSYTIDTLLSLREEQTKSASNQAESAQSPNLVLFIGIDAFTKFNTWHRWEEIIHLCHIALVQRPIVEKSAVLPKVLETFLHNHYTEHVEDLHESKAGYVTMQAITQLDISSTAIRHGLKNGHSAHYLTPDCVLDYIHKNALYNAVTA